MSFNMDIGAIYLGEKRCRFRVWAPLAKQVKVHIISPEDRVIKLNAEDRGYHSAISEGIEDGSLYFIGLDEEKELPDPASRFQPQGVHGPSQVVSQDFPWQDAAWTGIPLHSYVIYEIHVGTFTPEGTFEAIISRLNEIRDSGINNIEIMPVAQFPGNRNWGYDGVQPFAPQNSYGGPKGLKTLVDACHRHGIAITLDVVYNHFGPEGNYLREFGPYFTGKYKTPWGDALNFDDAFSDEVRHYFIQNALYWLKIFHIDALRLDAVHAIYDFSATPFLQELALDVGKLSETEGRQKYLIAESDLNDCRLIRPQKLWGIGMDAQWSDDFHHSLHSLLTGESSGYYADFGRMEHLVAAINDRYVYSGNYSPFRKRRHGNSCSDRPPEQFVVAIQNHDQIGNRMLGERLSTIIPFESQKLAAGMLLLSPYVPLIFMGQEYGDEAPFLYFVSHTDPDLIAAVRKGRKEEFKDFIWTEEPPDPEGTDTFEKSKLRWEDRNKGRHKTLLQLYTTLIRLRFEIPAFSVGKYQSTTVTGHEDTKFLIMRRGANGSKAICFFNFNSDSVTLSPEDIDIQDRYQKKLDSAGEEWGGPGSLLPKSIGTKDSLTIRAHSFAIYVGENAPE